MARAVPAAVVLYGAEQVVLLALVAEQVVAVELTLLLVAQVEQVEAELPLEVLQTPAVEVAAGVVGALWAEALL